MVLQSISMSQDKQCDVVDVGGGGEGERGGGGGG